MIASSESSRAWLYLQSATKLNRSRSSEQIKRTILKRELAVSLDYKTFTYTLCNKYRGLKIFHLRRRNSCKRTADVRVTVNHVVVSLGTWQLPALRDYSCCCWASVKKQINICLTWTRIFLTFPRSATRRKLQLPGRHFVEWDTGVVAKVKTRVRDVTSAYMSLQ